MDKMKTEKKWIIFPPGKSDIPYKIDTSDWDVSNEELRLCIMAQIYGGIK